MESFFWCPSSFGNYTREKLTRWLKHVRIVSARKKNQKKSFLTCWNFPVEGAVVESFEGKLTWKLTSWKWFVINRGFGSTAGLTAGESKSHSSQTKLKLAGRESAKSRDVFIVGALKPDSKIVSILHFLCVLTWKGFCEWKKVHKMFFFHPSFGDVKQFCMPTSTWKLPVYSVVGMFNKILVSFSIHFDAALHSSQMD